MLTLISGCSTQTVKHKREGFNLLTKSGRDHMNLNILSLEDILDGFFSGMSGPLSLPMVKLAVSDHCQIITISEALYYV